MPPSSQLGGLVACPRFANACPRAGRAISSAARPRRPDAPCPPPARRHRRRPCHRGPRLTWRRIAPLGSAVSGSIVIILQRASRSSTAMATFGPSRSVLPTNPSSAKPAADPRSRYTFARKRRLSSAVPISSAELTRRLDREQRNRAAVGQRPLRAHQSEAVVSPMRSPSMPDQARDRRPPAPRRMASRPPRPGPPDRPARVQVTGASASASARLAGFAALSGWRNRGRYRSISLCSRPVR